MKSKFALFSVFVILFISLFGCANGDERVEGEADKGIPYVNETYGFQLTFPSDWKGRYLVEDNYGLGVQLISAANYDDEHLGGILCFINKEPSISYNPDIVKTIELGRRIEKDSLDQEVEYVYAMYYASDVQFDIHSPKLEEEYFEMIDDLEAVAATFQFIS